MTEEQAEKEWTLPAFVGMWTDSAETDLSVRCKDILRGRDRRPGPWEEPRPGDGCEI